LHRDGILSRHNAATHPAEARNTIQAARKAAEREGLLAALAAEEENDQEPAGQSHERIVPVQLLPKDSHKAHSSGQL